MTPEQYQSLTEAIDRLAARPVTAIPPQKNGPSWEKIAQLVFAIIVTFAGIATGYIFATKLEVRDAIATSEAASRATFETKEHAKESIGHVQTKIDAIYDVIILRKNRAEVARERNGR